MLTHAVVVAHRFGLVVEHLCDELLLGLDPVVELLQFLIEELWEVLLLERSPWLGGRPGRAWSLATLMLTWVHLRWSLFHGSDFGYKFVRKFI